MYVLFPTLSTGGVSQEFKKRKELGVFFCFYCNFVFFFWLFFFSFSKKKSRCSPLCGYIILIFPVNTIDPFFSFSSTKKFNILHMCVCVWFFLSAVLSDNQKTIKLIAKVYPIYTLNVRLEVFSYYLIVFSA